MDREDAAARARRAEAELDALAWFLDDTFAIPGTRRRFGLEAIIGFLPGIGDVVSAGLGSYLILRAIQFGVPAVVVARMVFNTLLDLVLGLIPFLGDLSDFVYKSNSRNMELVREYVRDPEGPTRHHWMFLAGAALVFVGLLALLLMGGLWVLEAVARALQSLAP